MTNSEYDSASLETDYEYFKKEFEKLSGIDLDLYKEKQMKRRINTLIERKGLPGFGSFLGRLKTDSAELAYFVDYITINVTEFFRTPDQWKGFEEIVLRDLLEHRKGRLNIWSCACSTGEEPYSLAMSILNLDSNADFMIRATDIDLNVLKKAEAGIYDDRSIESLPEEMRKRFFTGHSGGWKANAELRKHIIFERRDLLREEAWRDCDLIVCRNILIYFTEEGKKLVYEKFFQSLNHGGYLFTGNTEQIIYYKVFGFKKIKNYIYQKE